MRRKQRPSRAAEPDYVDDVPMSTVLSELRSENRRLRKNIALSRQVQSAMQERIDTMQGKQYFEAQDGVEQTKLRARVLKKWLTDSKSQIKVVFEASSVAEKRQIYKEKLRDHLDTWLFKHLAKRLHEKRAL